MAYEELQRMVDESQKIVFFGGAGVSTESGIPDFRSVDGLYHQKYEWPPEEILSHTFFTRHTKDFYRFYRDKMLALEARPNAAHLKLAQWEREGKLIGIVTQNIDGLHRSAGNKKVFELHGTVYRNYCLDCGKQFGPEYVRDYPEDIPRCDACGGMIKPDVVLYEEGLDGETLNGAVSAIARADMLIVAGTSLTVYPAAGLIQYFRGKHLVLINRDATPMDRNADLVIRDKVGQVLGSLK